MNVHSGELKITVDRAAISGRVDRYDEQTTRFSGVPNHPTGKHVNDC